MQYFVIWLSIDLTLYCLYCFSFFFYLITWWLLFDTRICRKDYIGEDDLLKKIYTTPSSAECGSTFEEGHDYVISGKDNSMQLNIYRVDFNVLFSFLKKFYLSVKSHNCLYLFIYKMLLFNIHRTLWQEWTTYFCKW